MRWCSNKKPFLKKDKDELGYNQELLEIKNRVIVAESDCCYPISLGGKKTYMILCEAAIWPAKKISPHENSWKG